MLRNRKGRRCVGIPTELDFLFKYHTTMKEINAGEHTPKTNEVKQNTFTLSENTQELLKLLQRYKHFSNCIFTTLNNLYRESTKADEVTEITYKNRFAEHLGNISSEILGLIAEQIETNIDEGRTEI